MRRMTSSGGSMGSSTNPVTSPNDEETTDSQPGMDSDRIVHLVVSSNRKGGQGGRRTPSGDDSKSEPAILDRGVQAKLGDQLRAMFDDAASEPVPERFFKLLEELERKEKSR